MKYFRTMIRSLWEYFLEILHTCTGAHAPWNITFMALFMFMGLQSKSKSKKKRTKIFLFVD